MIPTPERDEMLAKVSWTGADRGSEGEERGGPRDLILELEEDDGWKEGLNG